MPALITGDEKAKASVTLGYATVVADAPGASGGLSVYRDDLSPSEKRLTSTFNYAQLIDGDRLQAGVSVPVVLNSVESQSKKSTNTHLGDIALMLGYEGIQELEYSETKPKVYFFSALTLPTGRSIYDSDESIASDVSGGGLYQLQLGAYAVKTWSAWDASAGFRGGRSFARTFQDLESSNPNDTVSVGGAWVYAATLEGGYSFSDRFRVGLGEELQYQSPHPVTVDQVSKPTSQRMVWNTSLAVSYLLGDHEAFTLAYGDQTLIGPAITTALARSLALSYLFRWDR
jgi:hypothetical protein